MNFTSLPSRTLLPLFVGGVAPLADYEIYRRAKDITVTREPLGSSVGEGDDSGRKRIETVVSSVFAAR